MTATEYANLLRDIESVRLQLTNIIKAANFALADIEQVRLRLDADE